MVRNINYPLKYEIIHINTIQDTTAQIIYLRFRICTEKLGKSVKFYATSSKTVHV